MLAGAAVLVARSRRRRRRRHVEWAPSDLGRAGAAGEHRDGGAGEALGHGLPVRDTDLPGAIGRLAVRRDQRGPRDLHRSCPMTATGSTAATCSTGWTTGRCCCCAARRRRTGRCRRATAGATSPSSTPTWCALGYATRAQLDPSSRFLRIRDGVRADEAAVQAGRGSDRVAGLGQAVFLPEPVRIATGDRRARWIRPTGCAGPVTPRPRRSRCS